MRNDVFPSSSGSKNAPAVYYGDLRRDILSRQSKWHMGYGACSVSGCPCQGFKETYGSDLCNNCGHKYTDHW